MLMCLTGCGASAMWIKNPEMNGFIEEVLDYSNEISQCSELTRNKAAQNYLQNLINHDAPHWIDSLFKSWYLFVNYYEL